MYCVYKIYCKDKDINEIYIGSTCKFNKRRILHKSRTKCKKYNCKLYNYIRENGGWDNFTMDIIEKYDDIEKYELRKKERYYIEKYKSSLNSEIPTQTIKEYFKKNKDKIKKYREKNKEKFKLMYKEYYKNNKEKLKLMFKEYRVKNKDKIKEKIKEKVKCECGAIITKCNLARHKKSKKHINSLI